MNIAPLDRILVPLDGSPLAECALKVAAHLIRPTGELLLARVPVYADTAVSTDYNQYWVEAGEIGTQYQQARQEAEAYLESAAARLVKSGARVRTLIVDGDRAGALVETAVQEKADLIAMTTHGRTGLAKMLMGSVTERVLQSAPCPVLALRPLPGCPADRPITLGLERMLVALDGSALAETALPVVIALAERLDAQVMLFRALARRSSQADKDDAYAYLEHVRSAYEGTHLTITPIPYDSPGASAGEIGSTILDYAESSGIGLIALTTHGRSGFQRWRRGSVTERILQGAKGAVLVVRPAVE